MAAPPDGRAGVPASAAGGPENKTAKLREILQDYSKLKRKAQLLKQVPGVSLPILFLSSAHDW